MTPATTTIEDLVLWIVALNTLLVFGTALWTVFSGPSRKNATTLGEQAKTLTDHDGRIAALEQAYRSMPTKDDMHSVSMALEGMKGEMKAMSVKMEGNMAIMERLEAIVSRHENHLLRG